MNNNNTNGKIIVIAGYLASGKSTFARMLSKKIKIPYLIKDTFKIALCESVSINKQEESSRFSAVTFDAMMYVAERMIETGNSIILEGNFTPKGIKKKDEAETIKNLIDKYNCNSLTYNFFGDTSSLHKRFLEREKSPERGQVNTMFYEIAFDEFDLCCRNLEKFDIGGKVVKIDGTDFEKIDYKRHIETAQMFINP